MGHQMENYLAPADYAFTALMLMERVPGFFEGPFSYSPFASPRNIAEHILREAPEKLPTLMNRISRKALVLDRPGQALLRADLWHTCIAFFSENDPRRQSFIERLDDFRQGAVQQGCFNAVSIYHHTYSDHIRPHGALESVQGMKCLEDAESALSCRQLAPSRFMFEIARNFRQYDSPEWKYAEAMASFLYNPFIVSLNAANYAQTFCTPRKLAELRLQARTTSGYSPQL